MTPTGLGAPGVREGSSERPSAVVLNLHATGLGIARSLGRAGVRVIGLGADANAPGAATRYAEWRTAPDSHAMPAELVAFLEQLADELGERAVLFPTNDADLLTIDRYRDRLGARFRLAVPKREGLHAMLDKGRLNALARAHGLPAPMTRRVDTVAELDAIADHLVYPAVLKPLDPTAWRAPAFVERVGLRKGCRVDDPAACRAVYRRIAQVAPAALVQEWIEGPEDGYRIVGAAIGPDGRALGAFAARKHLQYPPGIGLGCLVESVTEPGLIDRTLGFLAAIGFDGVCEAEYKLDRRTGEARLIEINPRHWDQHGLGACLGVDLPRLYYGALTGLVADRFREPQRSAVWLRGDGLVGCVKEAVKTRDPGILRPLWRSLWMRRCYAFWASDDPGPVFHALRNRWFRRRASQRPERPGGRARRVRPGASAGE